MDSQIRRLSAGSVAFNGESSEKEQWPLLALLSGRKLPLSSCPDAGQFSSSPCVADDFQSAAPTLELRGSKSVCGLFGLQASAQTTKPHQSGPVCVQAF